MKFKRAASVAAISALLLTSCSWGSETASGDAAGFER